MKKALITGITGQDGSYLAEILLAKGYEVHGLVRRSSNPNTGRLDAIAPDAREALHLHHGDLTDAASLQTVLARVLPDEVYNLGAQSHVSVSFELPEYTSDVVGMGALRMLEACRGLDRKPRFYQASTSELFGRAAEVPQRETTPFHPRSPYGCAKAFAYHATVNYREAYGLHASNGILFNHESPRRGEQFVTRKITRAAARIQHGLQDELRLGNLDAVRDWGWAPDFCEAMWLVLQQDQPDDYVVATGEAHSVREFLERAFARVGLDPADFVRVDPSLRRPAEVDVICGDPSKARQKLGWTPSVGFNELVDRMVDADLELAEREKFMRSRF